MIIYDHQYGSLHNTAIYCLELLSGASHWGGGGAYSHFFPRPLSPPLLVLRARRCHLGMSLLSLNNSKITSAEQSSKPALSTSSQCPAASQQACSSSQKRLSKQAHINQQASAQRPASHSFLCLFNQPLKVTCTFMLPALRGLLCELQGVCKINNLFLFNLCPMTCRCGTIFVKW